MANQEDLEPMQVLGFGTYDAGRHPRVAVLLTGLRCNGVSVHEVNTPLGFTTVERVAMATNPLLSYRLLARLLRRWATLSRRGRQIARSNNLDAVLVGYLGHFDVVLARALFPRTTIVLDQLIFAADTARDRGITGGVKLRLLDLLDRLAVACADVVLLDTPEHAELLRPKARQKSIVVTVGAPTEWFAAQPSAADANRPVKAVFFGLFTPLQGAPVIAHAIAMLAPELAIEISMLGSGQDLVEARKIIGADPRVIWRDWVDAADLPSTVADHDVCLGIFASSPKAVRVVPNKVYQGAAAGCAIVTSDTVPQRRILGEAAALVAPGDSAALARALTELVDNRALLARLRGSAFDLAALEFRPERVVGPLLTALKDRGAAKISR